MNLRVARAVFLQHLRFNMRIGHRVVETVAMPSLDLVLWGVFAAFVARLGARTLPANLVAGVLFWTLLTRFQQAIGLAYQDEFGTRNIVHLLASPIRFADYLTGVVAVGFFKLAAGWGLCAIAALALFRMPAAKIAVAIPVMALTLLPLAASLSLTVLGVILRFGDGAGQLNWYLGASLLPLSAVFYPLRVLPGWTQAIALALPSTHAFEAMRAVVSGSGVPFDRIAIALALDAVLLVLAAIFVARSLTAWRRHGHVSRYLW